MLTPPLGVNLICYVYLLNTIFYILSLILFYNRIFILGQEASKGISLIVKLMFILIPTYLFFRLKRLKKDAWFLSIYFHIYFIINNSLVFLEESGYAHPFVRIAGLYSSLTYSISAKLVLSLNIVINLLILAYLLERKNYFFFVKERKVN